MSCSVDGIFRVGSFYVEPARFWRKTHMPKRSEQLSGILSEPLIRRGEHRSDFVIRCEVECPDQLADLVCGKIGAGAAGTAFC